MRNVHYALVTTFFTSVIVAACSASVGRNGGAGGDDVFSGDGGSGGASSTSSSGDIPDGGAPDVMLGACTTAQDCAALNAPCKMGQCINGACQQTAANEYGSCDDGKYCTENDICVKGTCEGTPKFCASLDSCHLGVCDEAAKTCKNVAGNEGQQCDDMNPCTYTGTCNSGICIQGLPIDCSVFNGTCTKGICDPVAGCKPIPSNDGVACDNGSFDGCSHGVCQQGACASVPQNEGVACNDNQFCTITDKCTAGKCKGVPNTCAAPGDVCMVGSCDEGTDKCTAVPGNDGGACDDKNLCTAGETCLAGKCVGGQPANDGVVCDDQNGCTAGTSCMAGVCTNAQSTIMACINGDMCCPAGCPNDNDCLYWASGVLQNVPAASLTGWSQCWSGKYDQNQPTVASVLQQCDKSKLLLACRPVGAANFTLAAMGPRADVLFDCGQQNNCTKQSNGVGWYFNDSYSWGFAAANEPVSRNSCDTAATQADKRMCWHTGGFNMNSGYRCGNNFLNGDPNWERVIFEAD